MMMVSREDLLRGRNPSFIDRIHTKKRWARSSVVLFATILLFVWITPVSAKIRVPSSFVAREDNAVTDSSTKTATDAASSEPAAPKGDTTTPIHDGPQQQKMGGQGPQDYYHDFQKWLSQMNHWSDGAEAAPASTTDAPPQASTTVEDSKAGVLPQEPLPLRASSRRIPLTSFTFASVTSQQYWSRLEQRLRHVQNFLREAGTLLGGGLLLLWKTANDVLRYKFPVGIVSAWSAYKVLSKMLKAKRKNQKKSGTGDDDSDETNKEETPDTYKYVLRHTGRALDLDADDLKAYRHLGGIEQVRARLLRSALSDHSTVVAEESTGSSESGDKTETDDAMQKIQEQLTEALLGTLSLEFIPGGSHSEYIQRLIPSYARVEELAHRLGLLAAKKEASSGDHHRHHTDETDTSFQHLLELALQTAEVKMLDSKLRSIRDRLIRTTYRLHRTVAYWKSKVEAAKLASTTAGSWKPALQRWWSRLFFYAGTSASSESASVHHDPSFANNSLLEGDRLRLAFAQAAYRAEVVRLGKVLRLLGNRPEELPHATLTNALVEQQQDKRRAEAELRERQRMEDLMSEQLESSKEDDTKTEAPNKNEDAWKVLRNVALTARERIARNLDRKKQKQPTPVEKPNQLLVMARAFSSLFAKTVAEPLRTASQHAKARWDQYQQRRKQTRKRRKFLAIRFNADGRGKFSVQTYDEGSVAIEPVTARRILLREFDAHQKPWLEATNAWALEARGLIVDTIRETLEASIHPVGSSRSNEISASTFRYYDRDGDDDEEHTTSELDDLETTWRVRRYVDPSEATKSNSYDALVERQPSLFPALVSHKLTVPPPETNIYQRQWMFVYEMSRDINRLKRVGEGRSLKFKWKEVHWIHWLMQWNLMGLPSAALKIWIAARLHEASKPYVPRVQDVSREAYQATAEILLTRFWMPFKDLLDELTSRRKKLVTGVSLFEEEASLDIMLKDLGLGDGTPATRHDATIQATRQYESYMRTGLMWQALRGRLARLMLIQMQQLKVSMLDAAETIDVLFQSNKINMQLLAVIPAVGIIFVGAKVFVRFLFSVRAKDLRPIASVHAEMTDYLNQLESNIILTTTTDPRDAANDGASSVSGVFGGEERQLGEFALTLYNYLLLLDYSSPQPFSSRHCDVIHRSLTTFLGRNGSFKRECVTVDGQSRLLDLVKGKHKELSSFL